MGYEASVSESNLWNEKQRRTVDFALMGPDDSEIAIEIRHAGSGSWIAIVPTADLAEALNDLDGFEVKYTPERETVEVPTGIGAVVASPDRRISLTRVSERTWNSRGGATYQDSEVYTRLNREEETWQILSKGVEV